MKYIEEYNSIRDFKADLNSPECICAAQVPTPVGDAMGYQQNGEFVFSVSGTVISEDSLRTIDLSSFDKTQINISAVQTFINTCNVGDTMIFNPDVGIYFMDSPNLNIIDKAHWDGFNLILGVKEDDIDSGVQVWYEDGNSGIFQSISVVSDPLNVVKVKLGKDIGGSSGLFNPFSEKGSSQLRYIVTSQNLTSFGPSAFGGLSKLQSLTLNNPNPPSLYEIDSLGNANCQRIYVPKGSKSRYIRETNWVELANKIYEV